MRSYLILFAAALLLLLPFLGNVHLFDWDEINFAECSREMLVNGDYNSVTVNYAPFWEKPPLFFWMQAAGYHLFGVGEFAARFPNVLCALFTLGTFMALGRRLYDSGFGAWWPLVYLGSILPQFYFRSGLLDPWFNLFIFWGLLGVIFHTHARRQGRSGLLPMFLGGLAAGLGVLTKGPVALLMIGLCAAIYWVLNRFRMYFSLQGVLIFAVCLLAVPGLWFGIDYLRHGPWLWNEFTRYQIRLLQTEDAGHGGFPGYHFVILFFGCFPASFLFVQRFWPARWGGKSRYTLFQPKPQADDLQADFWLWMQILFWATLIVFSIVQSKIVHYSSLCYPPLTYGATLYVYELIQGKRTVPAWIKNIWIIVGSILGVACLIFPWLAGQADAIRPLLKADPFAQANLDALAEMHFTGLEALTGLWAIGVPCIAVALLNRRRTEQAMRVLFGGTALTVMLVLWAYIGRIESLSQGAAIAFQEKLQGQRAYVVPVGYRTYAHFFYARLRPDQAPGPAYRENLALVPDRWRDSLLANTIDRPVYVISKVTKEEDFRRFPLLHEIGRKNGFVFLKKD